VSRRPVIGIATQTLNAIPGQLPLCWVMSQRYVHVLAGLRAVPWLIPLLHDESVLRDTYDRLDGLFLTGGVDVDPARYGEPRHERCGVLDPDRDEVETTLLRWAMADHKPVLAVCRGIQILNVACGGTLYQDLDSQMPEGLKHDYFPQADGTPHRDSLTHDVRVEPGTRLGTCLGSERTCVNSMHHQGIKRLADGLKVSARAPDGLIEGVEGTNGQFLVAVQWHPEELTDTQAGMRRLFTAFLDAAKPRNES